MFRFKFLLLFAFWASCFSMAWAGADKPVKVSGSAVFYDDGTRSRVECMRLAAEQARIDALASAFGTTVSQNLLQTDRISSGREQNDFLALTSSEVRGEWIADEGDPIYEFDFDKSNNLIVKCKVSGLAKPVSNRASDFEVLALRNSADRKCADTRFFSDDDLKVFFSAPSDGYVAIFLEDESRTVFQLLPYVGDGKGYVKVRKGREYFFFDASPKVADPDCGDPREIFLSADARLEYNRLFVIFSPSRFSLPTATHMPESLSFLSSADFNKWLARSRRNDPEMGVKTVNLRIEPRN